MAFEDKDPKEFGPKIGLKPISGQKSMFEGRPKRKTQQEFQKQVETVQDRKTGYNKQAADLFVQFNKTVSDKTLVQNRNVFNMEAEKELLQNMVQLAIDINNDPSEQEGMGSLTWIIFLAISFLFFKRTFAYSKIFFSLFLFKTALAQRDRINELEFSLATFQKKIEPSALTEYIKKEITAALDNKKVNE